MRIVDLLSFPLVVGWSRLFLPGTLAFSLPKKSNAGAVMPLTKADIAQAVADGTGLPLRQSAGIVESLIEVMKRTLASGEDVLVSGFGKFAVKDKSARRGRNPATGEAMTLRARRVVTFKSSGKLRQVINGNGRPR